MLSSDSDSSDSSDSDSDESDEEWMSTATAIRVWRQNLKREVGLVRLYVEKEAGLQELRRIREVRRLAGLPVEDSPPESETEGGAQACPPYREGESVEEAMEAPRNLAGAVRRVIALHREFGQDWEDWEEETEEELYAEIDRKQEERKKKRETMEAAKTARKNRKYFTNTEARKFWNKRVKGVLKIVREHVAVRQNKRDIERERAVLRRSLARALKECPGDPEVLQIAADTAAEDAARESEAPRTVEDNVDELLTPIVESMTGKKDEGYSTLAGTIHRLAAIRGILWDLDRESNTSSIEDSDPDPGEEEEQEGQGEHQKGEKEKRTK